MIYLGKFHHDRTLFSRALESWFIRGIIPNIPIAGRKIQVNVKYDNLHRFIMYYLIHMKS